MGVSDTKETRDTYILEDCTRAPKISLGRLLMLSVYINVCARNDDYE